MSNLGTKLMTVQKNLPAYYGRGTLTSSTLADWRNVEYFPGVNLFVAVNFYNYNNSTNSTTAAWSSDGGITWTQSTIGPGDQWGNTNHGIVYAFGNKIVAIGAANKNVAYTTDGKNWTAGTALPGANGNSVSYANNAIIVTVTDASGNPSKTLYRATAVPGAWGTITLPYYGFTSSAANNKFFIYGYTNSTDTVPSKLLTSTDGGASWTTQNMPAAAVGTTSVNYRRVAYGNGVYVTIGSYQGSGGSRVPVANSTDGVTWTPSSFGLPNAFWDELIFTGKYFLAINRGEGTSAGVYYSYDGNFWYPIYNTQPGGGVYLLDIAYGNGKFVAVTPWYGNTNPTNIPVVGTA